MISAAEHALVHDKRYNIKKLDFEHLKAQVLSNAVNDHHELLNFVNSEWAIPLGFSMKMRRSPKINRDGKSIRFYCSCFQNLNESESAEYMNETGLM